MLIFFFIIIIIIIVTYWMLDVWCLLKIIIEVDWLRIILWGWPTIDGLSVEIFFRLIRWPNERLFQCRKAEEFTIAYSAMLLDSVYVDGIDVCYCIERADSVVLGFEEYTRGGLRKRRVKRFSFLFFSLRCFDGKFSGDTMGCCCLLWVYVIYVIWQTRNGVSEFSEKVTIVG